MSSARQQARFAFDRRARRVLAVVTCLVAILLAPAGRAAAQDYFVPTPDADSRDPLIIAQAAALGNDPARLFAFVRDEIAHESYQGSLRGARGALWTRAANSVDRASLLVALLRASNVAARYVRGTLPEDRLRELVGSMFPAPTRVLGCLEPGTERADPTNDARLIDEARDHFWVQLFRGGAGFEDADPSFRSAEIGQTIGSAFETLIELPEILRHTVSIRLRRELTLPGAILLGGGTGASEETVLEATFPAVRLVGRSLSVGHFVRADVLSALFTVQTNTYAPYLVVNERDGEVGDDDLIRGTDYREVLTNFPLGSEVLTGVFLDVSTLPPVAFGAVPPRTETKTIVDRIGVVARRQGGGTVSIPADGAPALSDSDIVTVDVSGAHQAVEPLLGQLDAVAQRSAELDALLAGVPDPDTAPQEVQQQIAALARLIVLDATSSVAGTVANLSDGLRAELPLTALARGYLDEPRVVAVAHRVAPGDPPQGRLSVDLLRNELRAEPSALQSQKASSILRAGQGLVDSLIEGLVIAPDPGSGAVSAGSMAILLQALADPGTRFLTLRADDAGALTLLAISDEAKVRIRDALGAGKLVVVPDRMITLAGRDRLAWLEQDALGNTIAVSDDGEHAGTTERTYVNLFHKIYAQRLEQQIAIEQAENAAAASSQAARNPQTLRQGLCTVFAVSAGSLAGSTVAAPAGSTNKFWCPQDPPIGSVLFGTTAATPELAGLGGAGGVAIGAIPDPVLTVPVNGAQVASVFRVGFRNLGSATDTFTVTASNVPAGFSICQSVPGLQLEPGETGEMTVALIPDGDVPPSGAPAPFSVTATSTSNPATSATVSPAFSVPAVHALTLSSAPSALATTPGAPASATVTVRNAGNVAENVSFVLDLPAGLAGDALAPATLAPGESTTRTLALTPDAGAPLNATLTAAIVAGYGAGLSQTLQVPVQVVVPGVADIAGAAVAADQLGDDDLAARLRDLADALIALVQDPASAVARSRVLATLDAVIVLLADDPELTTLRDELIAARDALAGAGAPGDVLVAIGGVGDALDGLDDILLGRVRHDFEILLLPSSALAQPQTTVQLELVLRNHGSQSSTYALSVEGLPPGVTASFSQPTVTLAPGDVIPRQGATSVFLSLTPTSTTELLPASFRVRATVQQAPTVQRVATGSLSVRDEQVSVIDVTPTPSFTDPGGQVAVAARVLNAVNRARSALASYTVRDAAGQVVFTSNTTPLALGLQTSLVTVNLGTLDTTPLALGSYAIEVTIADADGVPIPGATGTGSLLVGSPLSASIDTAPDVLAPGTSTVTTTLHVERTVGEFGAFDIVGQVPIANVRGLVVYGTTAYVQAPGVISIVDVSDPTTPLVLGTFGPGIFPSGADVAATLWGDRLVVRTSDTSTARLWIFSLADPHAPVLESSGPLPYRFVAGPAVVGDTAYLSSSWYFYNIFSLQIFEQHGDVFAMDLKAPGGPALAGALFTEPPAGQPNGGDYNVWQVAAISDDTVYAGSTTTTGANTQSGTGRVLIADVSSGQPDLVGELAIPGTVHVVGIVKYTPDRVLVVGSGAGWRNALYGLSGPIVLTTLDVTDPRAPQIVPGSQQALPLGSRGLDVPTPLGGTRFALTSIGEDTERSAIILLDNASPGAATYEVFEISDDPTMPNDVNMATDGAYIYTAGVRDGLVIYSLAPPEDLPVTVRVEVPAGTGVSIVPGSFDVPPDQIVTGGDSDVLVWNATIGAPLTRTWQSQVSDLSPGEAREVTLGTSVAFTSGGTPGKIELPATQVVAEQILGLDPSSRSVRPGEVAPYVVSVHNPAATPVTYALSVAGLPIAWADLAAQVIVPAGGSVDVPLLLRSDVLAPVGEHAFEVLALADGGAGGSVGGTLVLAGEPVSAAAPARGVVVTLDPVSKSTGRATPTTYTVRVVNTGSAPETFALSLSSVSPDVGRIFAANELLVPPGADAYRETTLTLYPPFGGAPGVEPFTVRATGAASATTGEAAGELMVLAEGVDVSIDPYYGDPGTTFTVSVTNTGAAEDTFDLAVAGPLGALATLSESSVTLAPGATQLLSLVLGALPSLPPGNLPLLVTAISRSNEAALDQAMGEVILDPRDGLDARFVPPSAELPAPGDAGFVLEVDNLGNLEGAYRATIVGTSGPVSASLVGLVGEQTQDIELFVLPGGGRGAIPLAATLESPGVATVTVRVQTIADEPVILDVTATLATSGAPTPTPSATPTAPTPTPTASPTPSPTPTPRPSPNPTPSTGEHDAFACYVVRTRTGTPQLPSIPGLALRDDLESTVVELVRERRLCNPASVDGATPVDPATHLACYAIRPEVDEDPILPETLTITNRFGEQTVRFLSESTDRTLCIAAEAHLEGTAADEAGDRQSLRCRRVRGVPRPGLRPVPELEIADELQTRRMRVRRIESLCTPVAVGGDPIVDPQAALACYAVSQAPGQPAFRPPGTIELSSEVGAQSVTARNGQRMVCVPTRVE